MEALTQTLPLSLAGVELDDVQTLTIHPGHPWPMGAHFDGTGVNFAVFSANAQAVDL